MIDVVRKPRLAKQVAASLCTLVIERDLKPPDRLPAERDLAAAFAVSRHVIREALGCLEARGLVTVDHGRGTIVRARPMPQDLSAFVEQVSESPSHDVSLEARSVFEAGLADLIVLRASDADIERLEAIVASMRVAVDTHQPAGADDVAFHDQLLRCTDNRLLIRTGQRLVLGYLHSSLLEKFGANLAAPEGVDLPEHEEIVAAIRQRDADRLRLQLRYHGYQFDSAERMAAGLAAPRQRPEAQSWEGS
ncbi:MAG: GntR family transcriptional regulator, transcriptional repressor for pyruvate dehydrogenase complex [Thermomicrobiales bacterium]|nr:GntR family transcriptional regulator, transcriptional repressor for pyruvate dehydrogenase complex [Thermomicrobiales bacterium]